LNVFNAGSIGGDLQVSGSLRAASLTTSGSASVNNLTALGQANLSGGATVANVGLNGILTVNLGGAIQTSGTTNAFTLPSPVRYSFSNWSSGLQYYRLGVWTADQGGKVIKLSVVTCNNGYNFHSGGNTTSNPVVAETTILFHTSNGGDFVGVVGNTGFIPNRCWGWGWAYSIHACRQIAGVYVAPNGVDRTKFEFWVALNGYCGAPLVEASTSELWSRRA
jgi:hypothetical protein